MLLCAPSTAAWAQVDTSSVAPVPAVVITPDRGWYEAPQTVVLEHPDPAAAITYTLDGSSPLGPGARPYDGPIDIDHPTVVRAAATVGLDPSHPVAHTYLFLDDVLVQADLPTGYPEQWAGRLADYGMDPDIVGPDRDGVVAGLMDLPVVSVSLGAVELFHPETGIYSQATEDGPSWERTANLEWFHPDDPDDSWQVSASIQMHGGASRLPTTTPKKGFRFEFKDSLGPSRLDADLFTDPTAANHFDDLVLKPTFNHSWLARYEVYCDCRRHAMYLRDAFIRGRHQAMGYPIVHSRPAHLFLDGLYWGIYQAIERPDGAWAATYFGGEKEEWDALNAGEAVTGDTTAWIEAHALAAADLADPDAYAALLEHIDDADLVDFLILNHWAGNMDWDARNWYGVRRRAEGERWRFVTWDAEFVMTWPGVDMSDVEVERMPSALHAQMQANADYRMLFADRVQELLHDDGPLTAQVAADAFVGLADASDLAIFAESARWGDHRRDTRPVEGAELYTHDDHWLVELDRLTTEWFPTRADDVVAAYTDQGLFPEVMAPTTSLSPGRHPVGAGLDLSADAPEIWFTTDGTDPRASGGDVSPSAQLWTGSFPLDTAIDLYARARDGDTWSPRRRGLFTVEQPFSDLVVNEIHAHPPDGEPEFLELHNRGDLPIALAGLTWADGIDWQAPLAAVVPANGFLVLTDDAEAFASAHGLAADGVYERALADEGERLALADVHSAAEILVLTYDTTWAPQSRGSGRTLSLLAAALDPADPASWAASEEDGGTPFAANFSPVQTPTGTTPPSPTPRDEPGCGCTSTDAGAVGMAWCVLALGWRRRRAPPDTP